VDSWKALRFSIYAPEKDENMKAQMVEYRFVISESLDSDVRDAQRIAAKKLGVRKVSLKDFATDALRQATEALLQPSSKEA
jgi:hypothetical protein